MTAITLPMIVVGVLAVLDVLTTIHALRKPGLVEANGIMAWLMRLGPAWIVVKLGVTAAAIWVLRDAPVLLWALAAVYAAAVANNWRLAR